MSTANAGLNRRSAVTVVRNFGFLAGGKTLGDLLTEIGRTYAPALLANADALRNGKASMEAVIDGQRWEQPVFPYQGKCLQWINDEYRKLDPSSQADVDRILRGTGCEAMIVESDT